jgi:hypothetical protein
VAHPGIERRKDVSSGQIISDPEVVGAKDRPIARKMLQQTKRQYKGVTAPEISAAKMDIEKFKREGGVNEAREILKHALLLPQMGMARARLEVMQKTKVPMPKGLKPPTPRETLGMPPRGLTKETDPMKRLNILFEDK